MRLEHSEEANGIGVKIVVKYCEISDQNWLNSIEGLQLIDSHKAVNMPNKKLLQGIIEKKHKVVLKIADDQEDIEKEWNIYKILKENKIPNIIKYFCFFRCADSIAKYVDPKDSLCEGKGNVMQVLVMEYLPYKSFKNFDWSTVKIDALRSCIKQALLLALYSFEKIGFIHGDYHLDNMIICRTQKRQLSYHDITIAVHGLQIKCIDFEWSRIGVKDATELFKDVKFFIVRLLLMTDYIKSINPVEKMKNMINYFIDKREQDPRKILDLLPLCDKIEPCPNMRAGSGGPHIFGGPKRVPIFWGRKVV